MQINQYHGSYNITAHSGGYSYIVVHYTGSGTSAAGSALANCKYFSGGNRNASAHYFIDDSGIWEYADPASYYTWHCGDGGGQYGITNRNSIGIEVCNNGGAYTSTEIGYLGELVRSLMSSYGIDADHVARHWDASRKNCPAWYAGSGNEYWTALKETITSGKESDEMTENDWARLDTLLDEKLNQKIAAAAMGFFISKPNGTDCNVYVSPLKAEKLTHEDHITGIQEAAAKLGITVPSIEVGTENSPTASRFFQAIGGCGEASNANVSASEW